MFLNPGLMPTAADYCRTAMCARKFKLAESEACNRSLRKWISSRRDDDSQTGTEILFLLGRSGA